MQPSNQSPLNNIGRDPRNLLIFACHGSNVGSSLVTAKFDAAVALIDGASLHLAERNQCVANLGGIFQNYIESGNWKQLDELKLERGLEASGIVERLEVGLIVSELLTISRVSAREESFREELAFSCLN